MEKMQVIMGGFRKGLLEIAGMKVTRTEDYGKGLNGLPPSDVIKFCFRLAEMHGSVVIRPSGTEPKLKAYISITAEDQETAEKTERQIAEEILVRVNG